MQNHATVFQFHVYAHSFFTVKHVDTRMCCRVTHITVRPACLNGRPTSTTAMKNSVQKKSCQEKCQVTGGRFLRTAVLGHKSALAGTLQNHSRIHNSTARRGEANGGSWAGGGGGLLSHNCAIPHIVWTRVRSCRIAAQTKWAPSVAPQPRPRNSRASHHTNDRRPEIAARHAPRARRDWLGMQSNLSRRPQLLHMHIHTTQRSFELNDSEATGQGCTQRLHERVPLRARHGPTNLCDARGLTLERPGVKPVTTT